MNVRQTSNAPTFAEQALPFLRQREAEHNLLISLLNQLLIAPGGHQSPRLISIEVDRDLVGIAMQVGDSPLLLSRVLKPIALGALANHLKRQWHSPELRLRHALPKFAGPKGTAAGLAEALRIQTRLRYGLTTAMGIHKLSKVQPLPPVAGALRVAQERDRPLLEAWCAAFETESFGELRDDPVRWSDRRIAQQDIYLWEIPPSADGASGVAPQPVSMVGGNAFDEQGGCIGPVYTPPEQRCRGYGTAAVAALSRQLLDQGCSTCYLFTDFANSTTQQIYKTIGYELFCNWDEYELSE